MPNQNMRAWITLTIAATPLQMVHATEPCFTQSLRAGLNAPSPLDPAKGEIHYQVFGNEHPETLVLIHGLDSAGATFDNITEPLSKKYRVIIYDQRGHGKSIAQGESYETPVMAADLKALLDYLKIDQAHILGHSMGGRTAARFAELYPNRVKTVMIEDMEMIQRADASEELRKKYLDEARKRKAAFANKNYPSRRALIEALEPYYGREAESLTHRRARENPDGTMTLLFNPDVSLMYGYQANAEDLSQSLNKAKKPVLFIQSDPRQGTAMSKEGAKQAKQGISGSTVIQIKGSGHSIHRTHPEPFNDLITHFIDNGSVSRELVEHHAPKLRPQGSIRLHEVTQIEDPKKRVEELSRIEAPELSSDQMSQLIKLAPGLTNSFEIGQYVRLAEDSGDPRWNPVLDGWITSWENQPGWKNVMRRAAIRARESITDSIKPIMASTVSSAERTLIDPEVKAAGLMPRGSAIATSAGALQLQGIRQIIHAASGSMGRSGPKFDPTLDGVVHSVQNSLELARRNGHRRVAVPFIGGKIFVDRIGIQTQELANQIVDAAVKSRGDLELRFVTFGEEDTALFRNALKRHEGRVPANAAQVTLGSITDFKVHGASAIINAANMEVQFGGGLSGAIGRATGHMDEINKEAQKAIHDFYQAHP
jgi:2-succinyl-6-hydroxy-2,4-cyclohexadiene-1-carboxylate synthase